MTQSHSLLDETIASGGSCHNRRELALFLNRMIFLTHPGRFETRLHCILLKQENYDIQKCQRGNGVASFVRLLGSLYTTRSITFSTLRCGLKTLLVLVPKVVLQLESSGFILFPAFFSFTHCHHCISIFLFISYFAISLLPILL